MLCAMPSLRQSSAMLVSPRNPSRTMRIFSSAEYCRRVALRMSLTVFSALSRLTARAVFVASFWRYDEPEARPYTISSICPIGPDGGHAARKIFSYPQAASRLPHLWHFSDLSRSVSSLVAIAGKSDIEPAASRLPFLGYGSISTPGLSKAFGSMAALAALSAVANNGGRCRSYHRR